MAFEGLQDKLSNVFKKLRGRGRLTEGDIREAMREVRLALLEADVSVRVARDFVEKVSERAAGTEILESLTAAQQVVKIVNEELTALMGGTNEKLNMASKPPTVVMMVGLQGAGKTTNGAKLAGYCKNTLRHRPLLAACDVYRPAAIEQLETVGRQVGVPVFQLGQISPVEIAKKAVAHARDNGFDMVFLDTAGRLHIDETLMDELRAVKAAVNPDEIMLVVDAMTGQDAVNAATAFDSAIGIDSVLLAKLDSDARGGAALSVKAATGKPIKFAGVGEKLDPSSIEPFHPDRMASRILGMGDVLSLIEKAEAAFDEKQAAELEKKIRENRMSLEDFLLQMRELKKMGDLSSVIGMVPGIDKKQLQNAKIDDRQIGKTEAIILSMTRSERDDPDLINFSRKKRIAAGSGTSLEDVNRLLKQFEATVQMTRRFAGGGAGKPGKKKKRLPMQDVQKPVKDTGKGFRYPF